MQSLFPFMLAMALPRGWLSPMAAKRALALVEDGLHPEQALLGTGLLSRDRYAECLSEACGLPFVDIDASKNWNKIIQDEKGLSLLERVHVVCLGQAEMHLAIGFADPEPSIVQEVQQVLQKLGYETDGFCVLESDWRKERKTASTQSVPPLGEILSRLQHLLEEVEVYTVFEAEDGIYGVASSHPSRIGATLIVRGPWARIGQSIESRLRRMGWSVETRLSYAPRGLVLRREHADQAHPAHWPSALQAYLRKPTGVLVIINGDEALRQKFSFPFDQVQTSKASYSSTEPAWMEVRDSREAEEALHFACLGRPLVIFSDRDRFDQLRFAGIPLHVVSSRSLPHGRAWELSSY